MHDAQRPASDAASAPDASIPNLAAPPPAAAAARPDGPPRPADGRLPSGTAGLPARRRRVAATALQLARRAVAITYLQRSGASKAATFRHLQWLAARHNEMHPADRLAVSRRLLDRAIGEIPAAIVAAKREGVPAPHRRFRAAADGRRRAGGPLARAEIDHALVQLAVADDRGGPPFQRLVASVVMDAATGLPVGLRLGFEPPSDHALRALVKRIRLP